MPLLERRAHVRYPDNAEAACQVPRSPTGKTSWMARISNLSVDGAGLLLRQEFEEGSRLEVELHNAARNFSRTVLAVVTHVTPQANGSFLLGCTFTGELSEDDLTALLS